MRQLLATLTFVTQGVGDIVSVFFFALVRPMFPPPVHFNSVHPA